MAIIRLILGKLILFFNWAFPPKGINRDPKAQSNIDHQTAGLTLLSPPKTPSVNSFLLYYSSEFSGRHIWLAKAAA
jgi:hypothetical protein